MKVTAKIMRNFESEGKLKAVATVCLGGCFLVTGIRIVECDKGLSVFMPSRKMPDGTFRDICFPLNAEAHAKIKSVVLEAYGNQEEEQIPEGARC